MIIKISKIVQLITAIAITAIAVGLGTELLECASQQTNMPIPKGSYRLIAIFNQNQQIAYALCFERNGANTEEIYFKNPSGIKIKARCLKSTSFPGPIYKFMYSSAGQSYVLNAFYCTKYSKQNLPVPIIVDVNSAYVAGFVDINDDGTSERNFSLNVVKEYSHLPHAFQEGLRDFYLFCCNSPSDGIEVIGIKEIAVALETIMQIGLQLSPFQVTYAPIQDIEQIKSFLADFISCQE